VPEYNGHEYEVERVEQDGSGYRYEFVLTVDGERVTTASEIEREGWNGPEEGGNNWTRNLRHYAGAYIDGLEAENERKVGSNHL
jgi:hypothetical protein